MVIGLVCLCDAFICCYYAPQKDNDPAVQGYNDTPMPILQTIDFIQPAMKKRKVAFGGFLTLCVGIALITTFVIIIIGAMEPPLTVNTLTEWSNGNVFPIRIHCQARSGCLVSQVFSGLTEGSQICIGALKDELVQLPAVGGINSTGASACTFMAPDEKKTFNLCYSALPGDGFSTITKLGEDGELGTQGFPNTYGFIVWSDAQKPDGTIEKMADPFHYGQNSVLLVKTQNTSFTTKQKVRHEWFTQLTDTTAFLPNEISPECAKLKGELTGSRDEVVTRLKMQAGFVLVLVTQMVDYWAIVGELGGVAKIFLSAAIGFSLVYRAFLTDPAEGPTTGENKGLI